MQEGWGNPLEDTLALIWSANRLGSITCRWPLHTGSCGGEKNTQSGGASGDGKVGRTGCMYKGGGHELGELLAETR